MLEINFSWILGFVSGIIFSCMNFSEVFALRADEEKNDCTKAFEEFWGLTVYISLENTRKESKFVILDIVLFIRYQ